MHPGGLRCSSVTYNQYAPSSRLDRRAPRPRSSTDLAIRGPSAAVCVVFVDPLAVSAALHARDPLRVLEVPTHGRDQAALDVVALRPTELRLQLAAVDGVASIVPWAIGNEG